MFVSWVKKNWWKQPNIPSPRKTGENRPKSSMGSWEFFKFKLTNPNPKHSYGIYLFHQLQLLMMIALMMKMRMLKIRLKTRIKTPKKVSIDLCDDDDDDSDEKSWWKIKTWADHDNKTKDNKKRGTRWFVTQWLWDFFQIVHFIIWLWFFILLKREFWHTCFDCKSDSPFQRNLTGHHSSCFGREGPANLYDVWLLSGPPEYLHNSQRWGCMFQQVCSGEDSKGEIGEG